MKPFIYLAIGCVLGTFTYLWFVPRSIDKPVVTSQQKAQLKVATFAGGCFWCTESDFEKLPGVIEAVSGYMGGKAETATYEQTSNKNTQHREVVQVSYDSTKLSYKDLVDYHWRYFDPTDNLGQFADRGFVYSPAVFYQTENEKTAATESLAELNALGVFDQTIEVPILPAKPFYPAEEYHQNYYLKNPVRYQYYRSGSGRDAFLAKTWGDKK